MKSSVLDLIDRAIADLEAKLNLAPGQTLITAAPTPSPCTASVAHPRNQEEKTNTATYSESTKEKTSPPNSNSTVDQYDICKLEFKVGKIVKAWVHPEADKLYCEEIDVGEEKPRLIASGLRHHYTLEEMQGRRVVVVANLKTKKLAGFASSGMVLCAAIASSDSNDTGDHKHGDEKVEFIEPPEGATIGEVITFEGLPPPAPWSGAQVEKKKVFQTCAQGMKTTEEGLAAWNGHVFMTTAGPCKSATIRNGPMR
jgi:methionine--tRNA ligase beta chain